MRSFAVVSKRRSGRAAALRIGARLRLRHDERKPDFVLSLGGDGTLLWAERLYPGIPKLLVRDSKIGKKYPDHSLEEALQAVSAGRVRRERLAKLEAIIEHGGNRIRLLAINDIIFRNKNPAKAVRFKLKGAANVSSELIGDGIVVATPFGSTGYYRSITGNSFTRGIGLAFNNLTSAMQPAMLSSQRALVIELTRGPAQLAADNYLFPSTLAHGDKVIVRASRQSTSLLHIEP